MMRYALLTIVLFSGSSVNAQTLDDSIVVYDAAMEAARQKVTAKYQELILDAVRDGDSARAGRLREWSQFFANQEVVFVGDGMSGAFLEYGPSIKAAGDALREAYLKEIEARNLAMDVDAANNLTMEFEERRLPSKLTSLQLYSSSTYVNHRHFLLRGTTVKGDGERLHATFELRAGLSSSEFVSIRAVNWPSYFIRHSNFRVLLQESQDSPAWRRHATWIKIPGLANEKSGVSFRAATHPDRFLRIRSNGEAWIDVYQDNTGFKRDATFFEKPGLFKIW